MKLTTSCERETSNVSSANGSASALATTTSTAGNRSRQAWANGSEGSAALTFAGPSRSASSAVSAPGPQPMSRAHSGLDVREADQRGCELPAVAADDLS